MLINNKNAKILTLKQLKGILIVMCKICYLGSRNACICVNLPVVNSIINSTSVVVDNLALFTAVTLRKYVAFASLTVRFKVFSASESSYWKTSHSPISGQ